jgi:hypothetical protein
LTKVSQAAGTNVSIPHTHALSQGGVSANAQLSVIRNHPSPTILALLSTGVITMQQVLSGFTVTGFGGD